MAAASDSDSEAEAVVCQEGVATASYVARQTLELIVCLAALGWLCWQWAREQA